jgi:hypothetical protein
MLRIERYRGGRYWALYDAQDLVVVTLYKRGAQAVLQRLQACPCTGEHHAATQASAPARIPKRATGASADGTRENAGIIMDLQRRLAQLERTLAHMRGTEEV